MFGFERNYHGSIFVEALVLIVAIIFCTLTALYTIRASHLKHNTNLTVSKTTDKAAVPNDTPPQGKPPVNIQTSSNQAQGTANSSNQVSVDIAPLNVTIILPSSMSDLTYSSSTSSSGEVTVHFSTSTITSAVPSCAASNGQGAFDTLIKASGSYPSTVSSNGGLLKQLPSYYLAYILPTGPCATNLSPANESLLDQDAQAFYSSLSTIQVNS